MKQIVFADDLTDASADGRRRQRRATEYVKWAAKIFSSRIQLVHILPLDSAEILESSSLPWFQHLIDSAKRALRKREKTFGKGTSSRVLFDHPVDGLVKLTKGKEKPDLLALTTAGKSGLKRLFFGSVAEEVIRLSGAPLFILGPNVPPLKPTKKDRPFTIAVATDLSRNSVKIEKYATEIAKNTNAKLIFVHHLYHAFGPIFRTALAHPQGAHELAHTLEQIREEAFDKIRTKKKLLKAANIECDFVLDFESDSAADAVLEVCKNNVSLIVLGTQGRSALGKAFLGSTTRDVLSKSKTPVIIVPSDARL